MAHRISVPISRRRFAVQAGRVLAGLTCGCAWGTPATAAQSSSTGDARLTARPQRGVRTTLVSGPLGVGGGTRDGVVHLPATMPDGPVPLLLLLHGATQTGARLLPRVSAAADQAGVAVIAPDSRGMTWDAIREDFKQDVTHLDRVLEHVFARLAVDPGRLAIGGFSDGASYALSLGLANGDLFSRVVAFSPGFVIGAPPHGQPRFFVSHGTSDQILPIDRCSRVIVPQLRSRGYDVTFREFDGRHELPPDIATEGLRWMRQA